MNSTRKPPVPGQRRVIITTLVGLLILLGILYAWVSVTSETPATTAAAPGVPQTPATVEPTPLPRNLGVTQAGFLAIADGMTLSQVERIIGKPGTLTAQSGNASTYYWGYTNGMSVVFRDGRVISKAESGLS